MTDEIEAKTPARDMLGDPIDANKESWGRPGFKKTDDNQYLVRVLKTAGWSNERIARRLGCDAKTLRKHFSLELSEATDVLEAEALVQIADRMREGNVSAARQVIAMAEKGRAAPPQPAENVEPELPGEKPLGKKEILNEAAKVPTGGWGGLLN